MKKFTIITLLVITSIATWACPNPTPVCILSVKRDIFYFKVDRTFIGATIEVYNSEGELILSDVVLHHKAIIDFYTESAGIYTIKVKKDKLEQDFTYVKKDESPLIPVEMETMEASISMVQ